MAAMKKFVKLNIGELKKEYGDRDVGMTIKKKDLQRNLENDMKHNVM